LPAKTGLFPLALCIRDLWDEVAAMLRPAFFAHDLAGSMIIPAKLMRPTPMLAVHAPNSRGGCGRPGDRRPLPISDFIERDWSPLAVPPPESHWVGRVLRTQQVEGNRPKLRRCQPFAAALRHPATVAARVKDKDNVPLLARTLPSGLEHLPAALRWR
jgi:hypothetical protein